MAIEIKDNHFVTYGIFYSMGVLTFIPRHFFITITDYWMYKFRDVRLPGHRPPRPFMDQTVAHKRTPLQANFISSSIITCQVSMLSFLILSTLYSKRLPPPPKRILGALSFMLVLFLVNTAFTKINTDSFQTQFFSITMVLAVLTHINFAVTITSLFEMVAQFPLQYFGVILSGDALCGIFSTILLILLIPIESHLTTKGAIYFGVGTLIILFTTIFYFLTKKKSKYFIYHIEQFNEPPKEHKLRLDREHSGGPTSKMKFTFDFVKMRSALRLTKWYMGAMVLTQGSTAMIFPGLAALVVSTLKDTDRANKWHETYFTPVVTFLAFNFSDFVGRETARIFKKKPANCFAIMTLAIMRFVLVPLILLCNAQPRKRIPVYFGDEFYSVAILVFGFTQGLFVNICIISVPMITRGDDLAYAAAMIPIFSHLTVALCSSMNIVLIRLL